MIVLATLRLACQGNRAALQGIWNRSDGKVTKEIELTDNRIEPFVAEVRLVRPDGEP